MKKNVLVIGSGGREHALVSKLAESADIIEIFCYPGNGGIKELATCPVLPGVSVTDVKALSEFVRQEKIDLTIVGPEAPLVAGIVDEFTAQGQLVIGPSQAASQLEGSKVFAKEFMRRNCIPTADYAIFDNPSEAMDYVRECSQPLVVKADGLAGGKGVYVCDTSEEATDAIELLMVNKAYGDAGSRIVIEKRLIGNECSLFVLVDSESYVELGSAVDYKRAFDGDKGPNTGGMGCYSPCPELLDNNQLHLEVTTKIVVPTLSGMRTEGTPFKGFLYFGLMLTADGPKVLEYNIRLGDPEAQVILPRLDVDCLDLFEAAVNNRLKEVEVYHNPGATVGVVLASENYPLKDSIHNKIAGPVGADEVDSKENSIFHGATLLEGNDFYATGGRILTVVGHGSLFSSARINAYEAVSKINFKGMRCREDIADSLAIRSRLMS